MAKPNRTFDGVPGKPSVDIGGPEAIEYDLDNLFAALDPDKTFKDGTSGGIKEENLDSALSNEIANASTWIHGFESTLDAAIMPYLCFKGMIVPYYGVLADIPIGWALCDGTNGTPDLRGKFVLGGGGDYTLGATGGSTQHDHNASTYVTISTSVTPVDSMTGSTTVASVLDDVSVTSEYTTVENANHMPPYVALYWIMRL